MLTDNKRLKAMHWPSLLMLVLALVIAFAVFLSTLLPPVFHDFYADRRLLLVALLIILATAGLVLFVRRIRSPGWQPIIWFLPAMLYLLGLAFIGEGRFAAVEPLMYLFCLLLLTTWPVLINADRVAGLLQVFLSVVLAGAGLYALVCFGTYLLVLADQRTDVMTYVPWGFVQVRYWSHIATWLLPLLPLALLYQPGHSVRLWRISVYITGFCWWWLVWMTLARGSVLGFLLAALVVLLVYRGAVGWWFRSMGVFCLGGALLWLLLSFVLPIWLYDQAVTRELVLTTSSRTPQWVEALAMSLHNFPLGMGAQAWITHEPLTEAFANMRRYGHPHNMYLMWAAEYGWLFVLCLLLIVWSVVGRLKSSLMQPLSAAPPVVLRSQQVLLASAVAACGHAAVSAVFMGPASLLMGLPVLVLFLAAITPARPASAAKPRRSVPAILAGLVVFGLGVYWWLSVVEYHDAMVQDLPHYLQHEARGAAPRFWSQGHFPRS